MAQISSRFSLPALKNQAIKLGPTFLACLLLALGGAGFTLLVSKVTGLQVWKLARDPAEVIHFPPYIGLLSHWSIMLWISAAVISLFGAVLMKKQKATGGNLRFITASGAFSLFLGLDDLFMLHDNILPKLLKAPEAIFYALYLVIILAYLLIFFTKILEYDYLLLAASILLFGLSRRAFITLPFLDRYITISDMLKYSGIVFWLAFFYRATLQEISKFLSAPT